SRSRATRPSGGRPAAGPPRSPRPPDPRPGRPPRGRLRPMPYVEITKPRTHVSLIRLNRSERLNATSFDVMVPFREAMEEVARDNDTWVCVITGVDRGFCSGADLEDSGVPPNIDGLKLSGISLRAMEYLSDLVLAMRAMPQPVIAAINGAAVGGGMCLSLGADIRYAAESAFFRAAGINNGLTACEL